MVINSPKVFSPTNVVKFNIFIRNSALNVCAALMNHTLHRYYWPVWQEEYRQKEKCLLQN